MDGGNYDYETAGFDGFLSRSVDNLVQTNLDSPGPYSTAVAFDRGQQSGFLGDILRIGDVLLDGQNQAIELFDGKYKPLLIGRDSSGNIVVKIAPTGQDAATASDSDLIFNSQQPVFKIFKTDTYNFSGSTLAPLGTVTQTATIPHNLPKPPIAWLFVYDQNFTVLPGLKGWKQIPPNGGSGYDGVPNISSTYTFGADDSNLYIQRSQTSSDGANTLTNNGSVVRYYLLQETASAV